MTGLRVLVTGSRDWTDPAAVRRALLEVLSRNGAQPHGVTVIHGDVRRGRAMKNHSFYALVGLSIAADLLGVLALLGVKATSTTELFVGMFLLLLAVLAATVGLFTSLRRWLSPQGAYYPASKHVARIGTAILAAVLVVPFAIILWHQAMSLNSSRGALGADECHAFAEHHNSGTGHCARLARDAGIHTVDHGVDTRDARHKQQPDLFGVVADA